jgi:hypothetical protein
MSIPGTGGLPARRLDQTYSPPAAATQAGSASGIFRGRLVVISGSSTNGSNGLFVYSGTPGFGNLILSISAVAGTDQFGNPYPAGLNLTQGAISGSLITGSIGNSTILNSTWDQGLIYEPKIVFDSGGGELLLYINTLTTQTFTASGATTPIVAPAGVTSFDVSCWGPGYAGQGGTAGVASGVGAGGGEFAREPALAVTPGNSYSGNVGAGVAGGPVGGNGVPASTPTTFVGDSVTVTANTPAANQSGGAFGSTNTIHFNGGNGGSTNPPGAARGGAGGGASGGTSAVGGNGGNPVGTTGGTGGAAPAGAGHGGAGGAGTGANGTAGSAGVAPGGGGGGGGAGTTGASAGGASAAGQIKVTYLTGTTLIGSVAAVSGTDSAGNAWPGGFMGQLLAVDPVAVPQKAEAWHVIGAASQPAFTNTWSNTGTPAAKFRLIGSPPNTVEIIADISHAAIAGTSSPFTLPTGYLPASQQIWPLGFLVCTAGFANAANPPLVTLTTGGVVNLQSLPAGTTRVAFHTLISLDA